MKKIKNTIFVGFISVKTNISRQYIKTNIFTNILTDGIARKYFIKNWDGEAATHNIKSNV